MVKSGSATFVPKMLSRVIYTVFFLSAFLASRAQDATSIIEKLKAKLARVNDYQAKGTMKLDVSFMKVPQSNVTVYYNKPNKFLIKQERGISITPKGGINANLNALFTNGQYASIFAGTTTLAGRPVTIIKLLPLDDSSKVVVSTLYIDEAALLIRKASTTTKDNGTYELEMLYGKYGDWGLPDKVIFIFSTKDYKLPKGLAFDYDDGNKPPVPASTAEQKGKVEINYSEYLINKGLGAASFR